MKHSYVQNHLIKKYKLKLYRDTIFLLCKLAKIQKPNNVLCWWGLKYKEYIYHLRGVNWRAMEVNVTMFIKITNAPALWPSNSISRPLSYSHTHKYAKWCTYKIICCNIVKAKDWKLHICPLKSDPDKAILFNCKKNEPSPKCTDRLKERERGRKSKYKTMCERRGNIYIF